jgi:1,4-dihydroxy-2-naphthoate octaprenyltransferase
MALGLPLVAARGWPVLAMGLASLWAAVAYMGGPKPIAYTAWGELFAFVFFGLIAVLGSEYVQVGDTSTATWLAAVSMGAFAAAALGVNNHRDVAHDRTKGRRTFAVVFGADASRRLYLGNLLLPFALAPIMAWSAGTAMLLLPLLLLPMAWRLGRDFAACAPGIAFNEILFRTFKLELAYGALVSIGAVLARPPAWLPF